jgi:hypothetical protein
MIWQLMKRDLAWRWMPLSVLLAAVFSLLWHFAGIETNGIENMVFLAPYFILFLMGAATIGAQQSETRFQAALPITVRQVYLSRVLSVFAMLWLPATAALVLALAMRVPADPLVALLNCMSILTLAMVVLQSAGIRGYTVPPALIFSVGFGCATLVAELDTPPFVQVICWMLVAGMLLTTWRTVPKSFQSAPLKVSPVTKRDAVPRGAGTLRVPWISLWRSIFPWGGLWILVPLVVMAMGARYFIFFYAISAFQSARPKIRWLFALPLHPRALLAGISLPLLLSISAGYLVGVHLPFWPAPYSRYLSVRASQNLPEWSGYRQDPGCKTLNVLPPVDFWVLAKDGKAPLIQAPWGETFQPPVFRAYGFDIFDPWAVGCGNSERFLDWQFSRASLAVYGRPIPRRRDEGWYVVASHVVVTSLRTQFVTLAALTGFAMLCMTGALLNDWHRFRRLAGPVRIAIMCLLGAAGYALVFLDGYDKLVLTQWISWALPPSLSGAISVAIPLLAILCWLLDTLFRQVELVDKPAPPTP